MLGRSGHLERNEEEVRADHDDQEGNAFAPVTENPCQDRGNEGSPTVRVPFNSHIYAQIIAGCGSRSDAAATVEADVRTQVANGGNKAAAELLAS